MTHSPYTYLTLSLRPEQQSRLSVAFHTGSVNIINTVIDDARPYLTVSTREASVSISTSGGGPVSDADVSLARQLFAAAARYLADCERLHTDHTGQPDQADVGGTSAADSPTAETAA